MRSELRNETKLVKRHKRRLSFERTQVYTLVRKHTISMKILR
jgi:hypothetical protein